MTVQEFYKVLNADYEQTMERFLEEERLVKYLRKFAQEKSFQNMMLRMEEKKYDEAYQYAHDLKGLGLNLGLPVLSSTAGELCKAIQRNESESVLAKALQGLVAEYQRTTATIEQIEI